MKGNDLAQSAAKASAIGNPSNTTAVTEVKKNQKKKIRPLVEVFGEMCNRLEAWQ